MDMLKPPHQYVMPVVREVLPVRRAPADPPEARVDQRRVAASSRSRFPASRG